MLEYIIMGSMGFLSGLVSIYLAKKLWIKPDFVLEISDVLLDEITNNPELQKKLYLLGAILGNGIKSGIGINAKGGKFKFEDLIGQAIAMMFTPKTESQQSPVSDYYKKFVSGES